MDFSLLCSIVDPRSSILTGRNLLEGPGDGLMPSVLVTLPGTAMSELLSGPAASAFDGPGGTLLLSWPQGGGLGHQGGGEVLWAGDGEDIQIGGAGRDFLIGGVGGSPTEQAARALAQDTPADAYEAALRSLLVQWTAADLDGTASGARASLPEEVLFAGIGAGSGLLSEDFSG
jgi:hypothetical protein